MPKIPVISGPELEPSSVLNAPKLSINVPRSAAGAAAAEQITRLGGDLAQVMRRVEEKRDRVAVENAYESLYDDLRAVTHGEGGFFTKRGGQVKSGATTALEEDLTKLRHKNSKDLIGNRQQEAYERKANAIVSRTLDSAARYESSQLQAADILAHEADTERYAEEVKLNPGAPMQEQLDLLALGEEALEQGLRAQGKIDPVAVKNAKQVFTSGVLKDTVMALAERNPGMAKERFDIHDKQGRFTADDRAELIKKLDSETLKVRAQAKTDELWANYEEDEKKGMAAAYKIEDASLRDDTVRRLGARYAEKAQIEKRIYTEFVSGVVHEIDEAETLEAGHDIIDGKRDKLKGLELKQARAYADNRLGGKVRVTDQGARVEAMARIDRGEIEGAEQLQLEYGDRLTPGDLEEVVKYQLAGGNVGGLKNAEVERWFKRYTTMKSTDRPEAYTEFWDFIKSKLEPGKKPTSDDIKGWALEYLTTPGLVKDSFLFFDKEKTRAEAIRAGDLEDFRPYTNEERDAAVALMIKHNAQYKNKQVDINNPKHIEKFVILGVRK